MLTAPLVSLTFGVLPRDTGLAVLQFELMRARADV